MPPTPFSDRSDFKKQLKALLLYSQLSWGCLPYRDGGSTSRPLKESVKCGSGQNGQELASIEIDYWVGVGPTLSKWTFDVAAYYYTYPGAFDPMASSTISRSGQASGVISARMTRSKLNTSRRLIRSGMSNLNSVAQSAISGATRAPGA
jgi:hypothetical protein